MNVSVVAVAAQCIEAIAYGSRKSFSPYKSECLPAILERCKEKNRAVVESLRGALDAIVFSLSAVSELIEFAIPFLAHKNPQVRVETLGWISRATPKVYKAQSAKKDIKTLADALVPLMEDGASEVRDAASAALGALIKLGSERLVLPFLEKLDKIKLAKVLETGKDTSVEPVALSESSTLLAASNASAPFSHAAPAPVPKMPPLAFSPVEGPSARPVVAKSPKAPAVSMATLSFSFSTDDSLRVMQENFSTEVLEQISDPNWKTRVAAVEVIFDRFQQEIPEAISSEILCQFFCSKPGWKDSNLQVLSKVLSALTIFAERRLFTAEAAALSFPGVIDKIADPKLGPAVASFFNAATERVGLSFAVECIEDALKTQKNPRVHSETLNWISSALLDFGVDRLQVRTLISTIKNGVLNPNAAVRTSAFKAAASLRRFVGPGDHYC